MSRTYFIDFDGTITLTDTCALMVESCATDGWKELNDRWERGDLSTGEVAQNKFELFDCSYGDIMKLMQTVEIDPHFDEFVQRATEAGREIYILSDGYDRLIDFILEREGLDHLPTYSNCMVVEETDASTAFDIRLPHHNPDCGSCGTCKTSLLEKLSEESDTVYIGDGYSDRCPIKYSDVVYAKDKLYQIAEQSKIDAVRFDRFDEIIRAEFCSD